MLGIKAYLLAKCPPALLFLEMSFFVAYNLFVYQAIYSHQFCLNVTSFAGVSESGVAAFRMHVTSESDHPQVLRMRSDIHRIPWRN